MYTGQVAVISNKATWLMSREVVDDQDNTTIDLSNSALTVDIVVTIKGRSVSSYCDYEGVYSDCVIATASIANGKVTIPGPAYQWQFEVADLSGLCAGSYRLGVKITINGFVTDVIDGTIAVIEGN